MIDKKRLEQIRRDHTDEGLNEKEVPSDPFALFEQWLQDALDAQLPDPNAMILATTSDNGKPSARVVLLKNFDQQGLIFFSNYLSRKGKELEENPSAALVFYWSELDRQVRLEGQVQKIPVEESKEYFQSRPRESQITAWISNQSSVISGREVLEQQFLNFQKQIKGDEVTLPPFWGGYRFQPLIFEFWQGRPNRLHDRFRYSLKDEKWSIERLSP